VNVQLVAIDGLAQWIERQAEGQQRYIFGIVGPPGCGKSTIAAQLGIELGAPVVPMDGFHLPNAILDERGLRGRKGSPETFAALDFVQSVATLTGAADADLWFPDFDREADEPRPDHVQVAATDRIVVIEGNYLLLDEQPWVQLRVSIDAIGYVEVDSATRITRLIDRHVRFGRSVEEATAFVFESDERNTEVVEDSRHNASLVISE
jgi:pantothenate kinase